MDKLLLVGAGGFLGANARYLLSTWLVGWIRDRLVLTPELNAAAATLVINAAGSFILGCFLTWFGLRTHLPDGTRLLIATGFCGAFTTFSTYAYETLTLARGEQWLAALGYVIVTNVVCLVLVTAGMLLGSRI